LIVVVFPYIKQSADRLIKTTLSDYAEELISESKDLDSTPQLIQWLKDHQKLVFFRISLISSEGRVLYDSHSRIPVEQTTEMQERYFEKHPELAQALQYGIGYGEGYSYLLRMKMVYVAKPFQFNGQTLIVRTAFPRSDLTEVILDFDKWFFILGIIVVLLLSVVTWFVTYHFSYPIDTIVKAIKPYQEGKIDQLPEIKLKGTEGDFLQLAETINSLSARVRGQIQKLTLERNEKEAVLESLTEGVIAVDGKMTIQYANIAATKLLGFAVQDVLYRPFSIMDWPKASQMLVDCQKENRPLFSEERLGSKRPRFVNLVATPKMAGAGAVIVLQDVTEQHKMQEMRKDFIANASHELKTPITIVLGFAETLHEHPDLPKQEVLHVTEKIVRNCHRMENLIKDLLALSNVENLPRSRLRAIDIENLIRSCIKMLSGIFPASEVMLQSNFSEPVLIEVDPSLLELAFMNLLENAAKYSKDHAKITINMNVSEEEVELKFIDKGIGIPEEDVEHIFERFYRVDKARTRAMGGSGLGLSIVKTIIEKHQGEVSVQSELGVGTTFTIVLPRHFHHE
jgi:PAS domain S-box-containing protein